MKHINYNETAKNQEIRENQQRVDEATEVGLMLASRGWKIVEKNLKDQLDAYVADNATNAKNWDNYQSIAGKIFGLRLLFVDIEDYIRMGDDAKIRIDEINSL